MNVAAPYNVLSLCAGVGGLDLGIRIAVPGARTICHVEREAYAGAVLGARMEDGSLHPAPIWLGDLGEFDPAPWRGFVHCVASGDPCQPNSVAGQRKGSADDRWLIDQVLRIVDGVRPDRVFRENVVGNADGQLAALVPPLEAMGYRVAAGIFAAREVGAAHIRERLFLMADATSLLGRAVQRGEPDGTGHGLGDASGIGRGEGRAEPAVRGGRRSPGEPGRALADAEGRTWRAGSGQAGHGQAELDADHGGGDMAHAGGSGLPLAELGGEPGAAERGQREGTAARQLRGGADAVFELPLFAPGPADGRWPLILDRAPHLEPAVRRDAAWLAHRVDRLRAAGNGVCSLAGAYAWRTLEARLAEAAWLAAVRKRA